MTIRSRSGAKKRASCKAKPTTELLSLAQSCYWALNRAMQSFRQR